MPISAEFERHLRRSWREAVLMLSNRETTSACLHAPIGLFESAANFEDSVESLSHLLQRLVGKSEGHGSACLAILSESEKLDPGIATDTPLRWLVSLAPLFKTDLPRLAQRFGAHCCVHEVAATPAGIFAVQDRLRPAEGLRLLVDGGLFFELLPLSEYSPEGLSRLGPKTLRLDEWTPDTDAVLFLTGPSGACRYDTGEVVRLLSASPPRIQRMGRVDSVLPLAGERMTERTLSDALANVCARQSWEVVHLHVAPHGHASLTGQCRGAHEWWIELRPGSRQTPTGPMLAEMIDSELSRQNPGYAERRRSGKIQEPLVRLLIPGLFDAWRERSLADSGRARLPVSLPDRRIADVLAQFARFHDS